MFNLSVWKTKIRI